MMAAAAEEPPRCFECQLDPSSSSSTDDEEEDDSSSSSSKESGDIEARQELQGAGKPKDDIIDLVSSSDTESDNDKEEDEDKEDSRMDFN